MGATVRRPEANQSAGAKTAKAESQVLLEQNLERISAYIINDGANVVYLALGAAATKNKGIRLNAEGGGVVIDDYTGVVSIVTAEGESVVTFSEV